MVLGITTLAFVGQIPVFHLWEFPMGILHVFNRCKIGALDQIELIPVKEVKTKGRFKRYTRSQDRHPPPPLLNTVAPHFWPESHFGPDPTFSTRSEGPFNKEGGACRPWNLVNLLKHPLFFTSLTGISSTWSKAPILQRLKT